MSNNKLGEYSYTDKDGKKKTIINLGALVKAKDGGFYVSVDKNVTLTVNGRTFKGKSISCKSPKDKFDRMLKSGKITEEQYQEKVESIPEYIRQELSFTIED